MSEELYFNNELRKCLNAAGLSDCGENDAWNYWYHRVHKAHDQAVDRVTESQRAENAKLRELVSGLEHCSQGFACDCCPLYDQSNTNHHGCESLERELGVEVDA